MRIFDGLLADTTNLLRVSAICVSFLLVGVSVPILFLGLAFPGEEVSSPWADAIFLLGVPFLLAGGFVFVSLYGARVVHSPAMRCMGGVLLSFPIFIAAWPLYTGHTEFKPVAVPLLLFSALLFSAFVFPAWLKHARRQVQRHPAGAAEQ
jgi:hypothetical protein